MARKKTARNDRKKKRFQSKHPNMTRREWSREKDARGKRLAKEVKKREVKGRTEKRLKKEEVKKEIRIRKYLRKKK